MGELSIRKSILLIGNYPPPYGGIPVHLELLAPYLVQQGWDVHVLAIKSKPNEAERIGDITVHHQRLIDQWSKDDLYNLYVKNVWERRRRLSFVRQDREMLNNCLSLAKRAEQIVTEHDIRVISSYHIFPAGLAGSWIARNSGLPLITTIFGEIYSQFDLHKRRRKDVEFVFKKSESLLSCSVHCAKSPEKLGLHAKVKAMHYGIETAAFSQDADVTEVRRRFGFTKVDKVVIFVGRMTREMGLHILLESIPMALEVMPHLRFIIAGMRAELLESALTLGDKYPKNVFVVCDVPREELPQYYAASTISVVPSINDRACLGLAAAEAMACGKPVIITNVGGGTEVVAEECGVWLPPGNPGALAKSILDLINDNASIERMGRLGRLRAVEYFDKELVNQRMELIFNQALATSFRNTQWLYWLRSFGVKRTLRR